MRNILFYLKLMSQGSKKGQLNTGKKKMRFALRTLLYYPWVNNLTDFILEHDFLSTTVFTYPILVSKLHRPYMSSSTSMEEKLQTIKDSYGYLDKVFPADIREELYTQGRVQVGSITGNNQEEFKVVFALYPRFDKEGEFNLIITDSEDLTLATLTYSIQRDGSSFRTFIGGLQGGHRDTDHNLIKAATKNLYGIFPKKALMESLYFLEEALNLSTEKICVGNDHHVYTAERYKRKRSIHSSYDAFWESLNGWRTDSGLWKLPETLERKDILSVPSKKRGQYRKRYTLLNELEDSILKTFGRVKEVEEIPA
ncbi:virulence factor [Propionigenium maris DSM 9537]|uniref:Virulence factor n=1 Tax=Propionigenium maris DSM 9537 TaxID=1123000 RepID=A0A9W6GQ35_9FUSO|nr:VirK/YbjX family protein [Propionigenium maris]GLI58139.1 virulence factor [Propionigenium maris DSM 9537]